MRSCVGAPPGAAPSLWLDGAAAPGFSATAGRAGKACVSRAQHPVGKLARFGLFQAGMRRHRDAANCPCRLPDLARQPCGGLAVALVLAATSAKPDRSPCSACRGRRSSRFLRQRLHVGRSVRGGGGQRQRERQAEGGAEGGQRGWPMGHRAAIRAASSAAGRGSGAWRSPLCFEGKRCGRTAQSAGAARS